MSDEVGLLHADKHRSYKSILRSFDGCVQGFPKFPKKTSLQCFRNILKKARDEADFFDADKYQSFLTVDFNTLGIKVFYNVIGMIMKTVMVMGMIKYSQSTQSNKFAMSLQYF